MKKKRYEDGGEVEFESKQGPHSSIDDMTRARAQDYIEEMQRPAPEIETREAPKAKKAAPKPQPKAEPKAEPKATPKAEPKKEEPSFFKGTKGYKNLGALFKSMREKAGITSYASGGKVSSASSRADGCAVRGKTRGKIV
jgi:hypothetical protein